MDMLPEHIQAGLDDARKREMKKKSRLRVAVGDDVFPVLEFRDGGFALDIEDAPHLRGLVDLYSGSDHLYQCLIVASEAEGTLMRYEFKRATAAQDKAPLDFARDPDAPIALIGR